MTYQITIDFSLTVLIIIMVLLSGALGWNVGRYAKEWKSPFKREESEKELEKVK